jgi:hypothetical protein
MEFWELYSINEKYLNENLELTTKAFSISFDIPNSKKEDWEYYHNKGFDFVFTGNTF